MVSVSLSQLRGRLADYFDETVRSDTPILVMRQGKPDVVVMAASAYTGLVETLHLLRNPANARRLQQSIEAVNRGDVLERSLHRTGDPTQP